METFAKLFGSLLLFAYHCLDPVVINSSREGFVSIVFCIVAGHNHLALRRRMQLSKAAGEGYRLRLVAIVDADRYYAGLRAVLESIFCLDMVAVVRNHHSKAKRTAPRPTLL